MAYNIYAVIHTTKDMHYSRKRPFYLRNSIIFILCKKFYFIKEIVKQQFSDFYFRINTNISLKQHQQKISVSDFNRCP